MSAAAVSYAKNNLGLDATCADLLQYDLAGREFDVACMWDTIEHLARPDLYIAKLADHMRTGALIAITTGDFAKPQRAPAAHEMATDASAVARALFFDRQHDHDAR